MSIMNAELVKHVFIKKMDFRSIIARAMLKKAIGIRVVKPSIPDFIANEDFVVAIQMTNENNSDSIMLYKSLEEVFTEFSDGLGLDSIESYEFFRDDFVKKIDEKARAAEINLFNDTLTESVHRMISMLLKDVNSSMFYDLAEVGVDLVEKEIEKANKKHEDVLYLASRDVEYKVMVLDKPVIFENVVYYIDNSEETVEFIVFPCREGYKYSAIPLDASAENVYLRKSVPEQLTRLPIEQIRGITGAKSLKKVHTDGFGGICETLEDAVRMAKLAATL